MLSILMVVKWILTTAGPGQKRGEQGGLTVGGVLSVIQKTLEACTVLHVNVPDMVSCHGYTDYRKLYVII